MRVLLPCLVALLGCGSDASQTPDASTQPDAYEVPEGYTRLIGRTWTVPAGSFDVYRCARVTLTEDTYITNIIAQAPPGTHHTVLSIAGTNGTSGPDGEQDCGVGTLGMEMLYASGVGTSPLDFPGGVGIRIRAGQQIHLNLHLFNAGDEVLSGESAILVKAQPTPPPQLAEMVFAGKFLFAIPSSNQPYNVVGGCTVPTPYSLFAVWPHMHQLARHQKVELVRGSSATVLHDLPYDFAEQSYHLQSPLVPVEQGDQIRVTCTYVNNTGQTVRFGDSSNEEMCFAGLYRYPALNEGMFGCTDNPGF
jgi:hypothetical protein